MIARGVDAKILQYEENAEEICTDQINLPKLLGGASNFVLINLEKDKDRYQSAVNEFRKVSVSKFTHLFGTWWKNRRVMEEDLTSVLAFLKQFNEDVNTAPIHIDEFSETNDPNVRIQDGPLGCYISHLRAMIHGYQNFNDYTCIVEDDIAITNTEKIKTYIGQVPPDWDIICLNSCPKDQIYTEPLYKFESFFHSTHFYIIDNRCFPALFRAMYPITDQVDVLISNQIKNLNIYNIEDCVYQKNIRTNTQNNLHVIFNSPHYDVIRESLVSIQSLTEFFANKILPYNEERNRIIVENMIYDVLYNCILTDAGELHPNQETYDLDVSEFAGPEYDRLLADIFHFVQCSKKGIDARLQATSLLKNMLFTLNSFDLHNFVDPVFGERAKAYSFGSTAHTYLLPKRQVIIKVYNDKLRWVSEGHDDSLAIFLKEDNILRRVGSCHTPVLFYGDDKTLKLSYEGESLYNHFDLPEDWEDQVKAFFDHMTEAKVFYPEFRLQNILVKEGRVSFCDFGLAEIREDADNTQNCKRFIRLLRLMKDKFVGADVGRVHQLSDTLLRNDLRDHPAS